MVDTGLIDEPATLIRVRAARPVSIQTSAGLSAERSVIQMCAATLAGGPLSCVRPEGHPGGHEFHSLHGSWVDDKHCEGGHG